MSLFPSAAHTRIGTVFRVTHASKIRRCRDPSGLSSVDSQRCGYCTSTLTRENRLQNGSRTQPQDISKNAANSNRSSSGAARKRRAANRHGGPPFIGPLWLALDAVAAHAGDTSISVASTDGNVSSSSRVASGKSSTGTVDILIGTWSSDAEEWLKAQMQHRWTGGRSIASSSSDRPREPIRDETYLESLESFLEEVDEQRKASQEMNSIATGKQKKPQPPLLITVGRDTYNTGKDPTHTQKEENENESVRVCALPLSVVEVDRAVRSLQRTAKSKMPKLNAHFLQLESTSIAPVPTRDHLAGAARSVGVETDEQLCSAAFDLLRAPQIATHAYVDLVERPHRLRGLERESNTTAHLLEEQTASMQQLDAPRSGSQPTTTTTSSNTVLPTSSHSNAASEVGTALSHHDSDDVHDDNVTSASLSLALHLLRVEDGVLVLRLPSTFQSSRRTTRRDVCGAAEVEHMKVSHATASFGKLIGQPLVSCHNISSVEDLKTRVDAIARLHHRASSLPLSSPRSAFASLTRQSRHSRTQASRSPPFITSEEEAQFHMAGQTDAGVLERLATHEASEGESESMATGGEFLDTQEQRNALLTLHRELANRFLRVEFFHSTVHACNTLDGNDNVAVHRCDYFFLRASGGEPLHSSTNGLLSAASATLHAGESTTGDAVMTTPTLQHHAVTFPGFRRKGQSRRRTWSPLDTPHQPYNGGGKRNAHYYYFHANSNNNDWNDLSSRKRSSSDGSGLAPLSRQSSNFQFSMTAKGDASKSRTDPHSNREFERLDDLLSPPSRRPPVGGVSRAHQETRTVHARGKRRSASSVVSVYSSEQDSAPLRSGSSAASRGRHRTSSTSSAAASGSAPSSYFHSSTARAPFRAHLPMFLRAPIVKEKYSARLTREAERNQRQREKDEKLQGLAVDFVATREYNRRPDN